MFGLDRMLPSHPLNTSLKNPIIDTYMRFGYNSTAQPISRCIFEMSVKHKVNGAEQISRP